MSLGLVDFFAYVLFGLKYLAIVLALLMFVLGLDDLFIDLVQLDPQADSAAGGSTKNSSAPTSNACTPSAKNRWQSWCRHGTKSAWSGNGAPRGLHH